MALVCTEFCQDHRRYDNNTFSHVANNDCWSGCGSWSKGIGNCCSIRGSRDDICLVCAIIASGLGHEFTDILFVFEVKVIGEVEECLVRHGLIAPFFNSRCKDSCAFK